MCIRDSHHGRAGQGVDVRAQRLFGCVIRHAPSMPGPEPLGAPARSAHPPTYHGMEGRPLGAPDRSAPGVAGGRQADSAWRPDSQMPQAMTAAPTRWYQASRSPMNTNASTAPKTGIRWMNCPAPVSYTHLDVYKRQARGCPGDLVFPNTS